MQNRINTQFRYYNLLSMLYITGALTTFVLAYKLMLIGNIVESCGIFVFPLLYFISDIVAEVYGYKLARQLIWTAILCEFLFAAIVSTLAYSTPPANWPYQSDYIHVLGPVFRFFTANSTGVVIGLFVNVYVITKWKILLAGKHFWLRSLGSSAIGEAVTSIVADIMAFTGNMPIKEMIKLMIAIYFVKLTYAFILSVPGAMLAEFLKKAEGVDVYDTQTNFNPFLLKTASE